MKTLKRQEQDTVMKDTYILESLVKVETKSSEVAYIALTRICALTTATAVGYIWILGRKEKKIDF